jgi:hypothetical protein
MFELPTCTRGGERLVDDDRERNNPLRTVHAGDHLGGDSPTAVPRAQGGAGYPRSVHCLLECDPAFFYGIAGELAEKAIPSVPDTRFALGGHRAITTVALPAGASLLSDRGLTWSLW